MPSASFTIVHRKKNCFTEVCPIHNEKAISYSLNLLERRCYKSCSIVVSVLPEYIAPFLVNNSRPISAEFTMSIDWPNVFKYTRSPWKRNAESTIAKEV